MPENQDGKVAYIEHFGITEYGQNNRYSDDQLEFYKKAINDKILLHREHGTTLLYTFSEYKDHRTITDHLHDQLVKYGFEIRPRSNKEILEKLVASEESRYIRKLIALITRFIQNFKTNGYEADEFSRMYHQTQNARARLFLDICNDCYLEYERWLKENKAFVTYSSPTDNGGKEAVTHYRRIATNGRFTLAEMRLETGRKNQIRVHMKELGLPVAGDEKYGNGLNPLHRLALHAFRLYFFHPRTGEPMKFETPHPTAFTRLFQKEQ